MSRIYKATFVASQADAGGEEGRASRPVAGSAAVPLEETASRRPLREPGPTTQKEQVMPDFDGVEKQARLDMVAAAALTGMLANRNALGLTAKTLAVWAWDNAEAMEAERERRVGK